MKRPFTEYSLTRYCYDRLSDDEFTVMSEIIDMMARVAVTTVMNKAIYCADPIAKHGLVDVLTIVGNHLRKRIDVYCNETTQDILADKMERSK